MNHIIALDQIKDRPSHRRLVRLCADENTDTQTRDGYRGLVIAIASGKPLPMPPVHVQAANALGALGRAAGQFLSGGPVLVSSEELDRRLAICVACDQYREGRCAVCGCVAKLKARLQSETGQCPLGKW
jgi:hypothetical protein